MNVTEEAKECLRLGEFKEFLRVVGGDVSVAVGGPSVGGVELRNPVTRNTNETYPVSGKELHAEILMAVWNHLQAKRCPPHFRMPILRASVEQVEQQCRNSKECDFASKTQSEGEREEDDLHYDLVKLQKFVVNHLDRLLTRLTDNAEVGNLRNYADAGSLCPDSQPCQCVARPPLPSCAVANVKNKPRKMEDRHVSLERYSEMYQLTQPCSFYGVFDGHSGSLAASYAAHQLPHLLAERLAEGPKDCRASTAADSLYREAFEWAFLQADDMFTRKRLTSGTTAVCALIAHPNAASQSPHLYVAWVGDSKAMLVSSTTRLQLVKPHKPDSPDERRRIESSDSEGYVMFIQGHWRVNGILNVARSIGDYTVQAVIAEPDFVDVPLTKAHDFLVLGTDGLWDHVDEATIVASIYSALENPDEKFEDIPKRLLELAKQGDSQDNITAMVVLLKERQEIVDSFKASS